MRFLFLGRLMFVLLFIVVFIMLSSVVGVV